MNTGAVADAPERGIGGDLDGLREAQAAQVATGQPEHAAVVETLIDGAGEADGPGHGIEAEYRAGQQGGAHASVSWRSCSRVGQEGGPAAAGARASANAGRQRVLVAQL
ncbi:MAG: hypothetical protein U1E77_10430 [Inhella sp.]